MSRNFGQRYESGEFIVWDEILNSAEEIVSSPELYAEATEVAKALMKRVNTNYLALRKTLIRTGITLAPKGVALTDKDLAIFTNRFGPMPLSMDVFYKTIGSMTLAPVDYDYGPNLLERQDGIDLLTLDPLVIGAASDFEWALDEYDAEFTEDEEEDNPFSLLLCPDFLHKADISGGEPYTVCIPASTPENKLDPLVNSDDESRSFVGYLRHCFKWGGFPGLQILDKEDDEEIDLNRMIAFESVRGDWRTAAQSLLKYLRQDLIPF